MAVVLDKVAVFIRLPAGNSRVSYPQAVLAVLVFTALYLSSRTTAATRCCVHDEVEIYHPNVLVNGTEKYQCFPCPKCPFGQGGSVECGSRVPRGTPVECRECVEGKNYSDVHDRGMCKPCPDCGNKRVLRECSLREKTVCSDDCKLGFHYKSLTRTCEKCSPCCVGKKYAKYNIYPHECRNMPLNEKCEQTHFTDNCPHMRVPSTASHPTATLSSKPMTTLKTMPPPNSVTPHTTTPSSINDVNKEHKGNTNRAYTDSSATEEDSPAKSPLTIVVFVALGLLLAFAITCIMVFVCRKKPSACEVASNSSSTTSIPDATFSAAYPMGKTGANRRPKKCTKDKRSVQIPNRLFQGLNLNESYSDSEQEMLEEEETKLIQKREPQIRVLPEEEFDRLLEHIPKDLHLLSLPGRLRDNVLKRLDTPSKHLHGWHKIGSEMKLDKVDLDYLTIEYQRETGSPTTQLFEMLNAKYAAKMTIRMFVKVLHQVQRDDIATFICNWQWKEGIKEGSNCKLIMSE